MNERKDKSFCGLSGYYNQLKIKTKTKDAERRLSSTEQYRTEHRNESIHVYSDSNKENEMRHKNRLLTLICT